MDRLMKKLLLILLLSISQITSADEYSYNEESLRNFEVLGMSIGDNLMDFMPEVDIFYGIEEHINLNRYSNLKEPHKFLEITVPKQEHELYDCLLYTSPSPRDRQKSRMPSSA